MFGCASCTSFIEEKGKKKVIQFSYTDNTRQLHIYCEAVREGGGIGTGSTFPQALGHHQVHVCAKSEKRGYQGTHRVLHDSGVNYLEHLLPEDEESLYRNAGFRVDALNLRSSICQYGWTKCS